VFFLCSSICFLFFCLVLFYPLWYVSTYFISLLLANTQLLPKLCWPREMGSLLLLSPSPSTWSFFVVTRWIVGSTLSWKMWRTASKDETRIMGQFKIVNIVLRRKQRCATCSSTSITE
jgi:hypothetical protein